ncbi:MAG TPA: universal stress protein [Tepidisphaeraceae bacterium]|nr:universal stress protein [Tepidisphaeraceae bacterium]
MTDFSRDDLTDTMSSFEAAVSAPHVQIPAIAPRVVLLALDGTNQDPAALALSVAVANRAGAAEMHLTYAYEGPSEPAREHYLAERAGELSARAGGLTTTHSRPHVPAGAAPPRSFHQILELATQRNCDLIVMPAPYLDDYVQLGTTSTGTNLDMLLRHRRTPLLVVREAYPAIERCLDHLIVPLNLVTKRGTDVLAWAFRLAVPGSATVHLVATADTQGIAAVAPAAGGAVRDHDIDELELAGLAHGPAAGLVAAAQRRAADLNVACRVSVRTGQPLEQLLAFTRQQERSLILTGCPESCSATGYLQVQALIRESPDPVMVI